MRTMRTTLFSSRWRSSATSRTIVKTCLMNSVSPKQDPSLLRAGGSRKFWNPAGRQVAPSLPKRFLATEATVIQQQQQTKRKTRSSVWPYVLVGISSAFGVAVYLDEGLRRSLQFWIGVLPPFMRYKYAEFITRNETDQAKVDAVFNPLHDKYAPVIEKLTLKLRGFYLKNAQLVSTLDYFVPPQYLAFCKRMQSEVPTELLPGQAKAILEKSLRDKDLDFVQLFSEFEDVPIGSASIGQAHRAKLKDGTTVAIKIMAPGIEEKFRNDIATILRFCQLAMPQHVAAMKEIEKQFATEFDYLGEAENLNKVRRNVLPHFGDKVEIPKPYMELSSKNVLVMDFLEGPSLVKGIREAYRVFCFVLESPFPFCFSAGMKINTNG